MDVLYLFIFIAVAGIVVMLWGAIGVFISEFIRKRIREEEDE